MLLFIVFLSVSILLVSAQNNEPESSADIPNNLGINTDNVLNKEIIIPDNLAFFMKVVFGLSTTDKVDLQTFVVLIVLWIVLFLIIHSILEIVPFFGSGLKSWFGALVITVLIAITGAIRQIALFFFGAGNIFGFLAGSGILRFISVLIILVVAFYVLFKLIKVLKHKLDLEEMVSAGYDIALERARAKAARSAAK